jgi:hypothetical protein
MAKIWTEQLEVFNNNEVRGEGIYENSQHQENEKKQLFITVLYTAIFYYVSQTYTNIYYLDLWSVCS